jgi:CDP-diacylglycerol--glycerol-3-phosphate 3-phosphatidyltransferase
MNLKDLFKISNLLSIFRLLLAIPFWILLDNFDNQSIRYFAAGLCLFAAFTDILDGYFARKLNQVTELGKIVDPLADKVVIGVIILKLFLIGEVSLFLFLLIIGRDVLILIGGLFIAKKIGWVIPSNIIGKITVISISLLLLLIIIGIDRSEIVFELFYHSSIALIFISLIMYSFNAYKKIKNVNEAV